MRAMLVVVSPCTEMTKPTISISASADRDQRKPGRKEHERVWRRVGAWVRVEASAYQNHARQPETDKHTHTRTRALTNEEYVVSLADAVVDEGAVVVEHLHAVVAHAAVRERVCECESEIGRNHVARYMALEG